MSRTDSGTPVAKTPDTGENELLHVALDKIRLNPVALRDVQKKEVEFTELVDSIKNYGVMQPILIKRKTGADGKEFELVDGLQRYSASLEAGKITIPALVKSVEEADQIIAQVIANAVRLNTRPVEYAKGLMKILGYNPTWSESQLASRVSKSPSWVGKQLGLLRLHDQIKPLVDDGRIVVANAYALSKLPEEEQLAWMERAMTTDANQFTQQVFERAKSIKDANRKGQDAGEEKFAPTFHIRPKKEIEAEITNPEFLRALIKDTGLLTQSKTKDDAALNGAILALRWAGSSDPKTLQARESKWKEQKEKQKQDKTRREAEKTAKRQKEADEKASEARKKADEAKKAADALPPLEQPVAAAK